MKTTTTTTTDDDDAALTLRLPRAEAEAVAALLEQASRLFSNRSCNDHPLPDTDANWAMMERMMAANVRQTVEEWRAGPHREERPDRAGQGAGRDELVFMDWWLAGYLADVVAAAVARAKKGGEEQ